MQYFGTSTTFAAASSLSSNTVYNIFVYSYNNSACGGGPVYSATSVTTTATTIPGAPTIGTATAGNLQASVAFTAPTGTATITSYTATSTPEAFTGTGSTSAITVTGLTNGTAYTFTVTATNAGGTGAASAASNSVTPLGPCSAPGVATGLNLISPYSALVAGNFTAPAGGATNYLVIRTTSSSAPTTPTNGTSYTTGSSVLGGYIASNTATTGFADNSGTAGTQYWYWVYSYNTGSTCSGGPVYSSSNVSSNVMVSTTVAVSTTYSSTTTYTVPAGVTAITVSAWGAGGGSGGGVANSSDNASGGGGGGAFVQQTYNVTPGDQYSLTVGAGGTAGTTAGTAGSTGNSSTVTTISGTTTNLSANGGGGGGGVTTASTTSGTGTAGTGGAAGTSYNASFAGGNGTAGFATTLDETGGAGGGGAGNAAAGGNGSGSLTGTTGGTGGAGSPNSAPWIGGAGASGVEQTQSIPGVAGIAPGGGAAGESNYTTAEPGAAGGNGQIIITYPEQPCAAPAIPTGLNLSNPVSGNSVTGTFTAPSPAPSNYLVIRTAGTTAATAPINGTTYTAGQSALGGTIISVATTTGFTDNTTALSTQYTYTVYSYNNTSCTGGPAYSTTSLSGVITTSNVAPLYWAGIGTTITAGSPPNTATNFNTAADWSTSPTTYVASASAPSAINACYVNLTATASTSQTIALSGNITIGSLTVSAAFSSTTQTVWYISAATYALTINGNASLSMPTAGKSTSFLIFATTTGSVSIGGNTNIGNTGDQGVSAISSGTTAQSTGTWTFGGNLAMNTKGSSYYNLYATFNGSNPQTWSYTNGTYTAAINSLTVNSNLTIANTSATTFMYMEGNLTVGANYSLTIPSGSSFNQYNGTTGSSASTFSLGSGSTLYVGGAATSAVNSVTGSNFPGYFATYTFNPASTIEYDGPAAQNVYSSASNTPVYGNLTIGDATTAPSTVATATAALTIKGSMLINSGATFAGGTALTHTISGNWTNSGGTFTYGTSIIAFNAVSPTIQQLISGGRAVADQFYSITHTGAGTLQLVNNNVTANGIFTNSAGTYDCNTNSLNTTVTGLTTVSGGTYLAGSGAQTFNGGLTVSGASTNFTSATGLTLSAATVTLTSGTLTAPDATGSFTVTGNWVNNGGTFTNNGGAVTFGGASQTIGGTATTQAFDSIQVANTGTLSLTGSTTALTLSGNLDLGQSGNATNGFAFAPGIFALGQWYYS